MYTRNNQNKERDERRKKRSEKKRGIETPIGNFKDGDMIETPLGRFKSSGKPKTQSGKPKNLLSDFNSVETPSKDPLNIRTPIEQQDEYYSQRGRRMDGSVVESKQELEEKAVQDAYLTDEEELLRDVSDFEEGVDYVFDSTKGMDGSIDRRSLQGGAVFNDTNFSDHLAPESHISQSAYDTEEFKGVNPRNLSQRDLSEIKQLRQDEFNDDSRRVRNIVDEVELLSGGNNDSLMNGQDLNIGDDEGKYDDTDDQGHSTSGLDRGRNSHRVTEIDLENMDESLSNLFEEDGNVNIIDDVSSIGRRFGDAIPRVRNFGDDISSIMSGSDSITNYISELTDLSDQDGSWFSRDSKLEKNIPLNERMGSANKIPMNKETRDNIGKFNPMMNAGNRLLMSQGASLGTINEMRKKKVNWKQPNRTFKNNQVDLIRLGNQTKIKMDNEFAP